MSTRRKFIHHAIGAAAITFVPAPFFAQGLPGRKITVAVMGVRSRGLALATNFAQMPDTEVAYICDVDQEYMDRALAEVEKIQKRRPKGEKDIRKVLEDKSVDAIAIAAPDHWHAPAAILGVQAGKHVYVEKPCSHNPREGELLIEAEKKYGRVIQMGNQRRSWDKVMEGISELRAGVIGKVYFAKGWYTNNRASIGFGKEIPPPAKLDWDLWQGPAPRTAYHDNYHPYEWHWFRRWGTGEALNNGTHEIDVIRWGLGADYPSSVVATGGRYHYRDDWQFPDTLVVNYQFENGATASWESRSCNPYLIEGDSRGNIFYGEKGTMVITGNNYFIYDNNMRPNLVKSVKQERANAEAVSNNTMSPDALLDAVHIKNFLDAIRDGKPVHSPIHEGQKSVLMCQLANISWFTGRQLHIDPRNGHIIGDPDAMSHWSRDYEPGWAPQV